jgi:hypothetical protein
MADSSPSSELSPPQSCAFDAEKLVLKLSVTLAADRDAVDPVVRSVMNVVREMKCAPGREDDIEMPWCMARKTIHPNLSNATWPATSYTAC